MMIEKETSALTGPERLKAFEDNWQTEMGAWFPGERVVLRGKDVFSALNNYTWMEYLYYAVTGIHSPKHARVIEGMWTLSSSFPDPRLWNNRIAAHAGTTGSTGALAMSAGIAASEATIYGLKPIKGAIDFFYRAITEKNKGSSIETIVKNELKKNRSVSGYGRPLVDEDERIAPVLKFLAQQGANKGPFIDLAFEVDDYLKNSRYRYKLNIAGLNAATAADSGVTADEYYYMSTLAFSAGILPCYIDAKNKPGCFFPLPTDRINATGAQATRSWKAL